MGRGCCQAGTGTLSIRVHSVPASSAPGRRLVAPRPGTPRQGPERPGPGARSSARGRARGRTDTTTLFIRHAAADTRDIRYVLHPVRSYGRLRRAELADLCAYGRRVMPN